MKEPISQIIALSIGLLSSVIFIVYWRIKFGKLFSSISRTAYHLNAEKKVLQFSFFILIMSASVIIGGQTTLSAIGGGWLSVIAAITGYNPNITNNKWEDRFHVFFVEVPFTMFLADFLRIGIRSYIAGSEYIFWTFVSLEAIFFVYLWLVFLFKIRNHTTILEYGMILTVVSGYLFNAITK